MTMWNRRTNEKGSTLLEFTLVGLPTVLILLSTFELSRGMWMYSTLGHAVKEGTRFASVHGKNCGTSPNACTATIGQVAGRIQQSGVGLLADKLNLSFTTSAGTVSCRLDQCLSNNTTWPPSNANTPGLDIEVSGRYPFQSVICVVWPGARTVTGMPVVNLPAASRQPIEY
jgi:Flp pilus assembly protein TadG